MQNAAGALYTMLCVAIVCSVSADNASESALNKPILRISIPYTDLKPIINQYIHDKWLQT